RLGALELLERLGECAGRGTVVMGDFGVEAAEGQVGERAAGERRRVVVGGLCGVHVASQLVHAPDSFPDVARMWIEVACFLEERLRAVEIAPSHQELALARQDVFGTDGGRLRLDVELAARLEGFYRVLQLVSV